jgi:tetratricopeptide (TPR) repeat protein
VQHLLEQNEAAVKTYEEVIDRIKKDDRLEKPERDKSIEEVERQMIVVFVGLKQGDRAIKIIDERIKANKNSWKLVRLKAQVQHSLDENEAALKTYNQVIDLIKKDDQLTKGEQEDFIDQIEYSMTGVYVDMKEIKKATDILQKLLEKEPDNPTYNNDLGFIWADHDLKLAESEKLIRKALEEDRKRRKADDMLAPEDDKDSGAYLDSLGWVLYKQKKYKEAKPFLVEAAKDEDAQHIEIFDHLGDVEMALGDKDAAIAAWKKGVEIAGTSKREQERKTAVEKKLKDVQK